jgi:acetylornithine deacetylase
MKELLRDCLRIPSISGSEGDFVRFIRDFAGGEGLMTDLFETTEAELSAYPVARAKHIPLAGRPTLVIGLTRSGHGPSILFNAHSDVVSPGRVEDWRFGPWSGTEHDARFYGRGACDVKGPLVSAIWAMLAVRAALPDGPPGPVQLELVPGEEDCVTLGTLTSVHRGYRADACIVLEPTEGLPRNASRPGLRFEILCRGRAVHGTVKWLGLDAIQSARAVLKCLADLESRWNDRSADPLFGIYPIARPVTVDTIHGGQWQGMICDACRIGGYLELLPRDEPAAWARRLVEELSDLLDQDAVDRRNIRVEFPESYSGHYVDVRSAICREAEGALDVSPDLAETDGLEWSGWAGFNSGCEAGLRANLQRTPTLVWGPGSLEQAHCVDEFVDFAQVHSVACMFARLVGNGLPSGS